MKTFLRLHSPVNSDYFRGLHLRRANSRALDFVRLTILVALFTLFANCAKAQNTDPDCPPGTPSGTVCVNGQSNPHWFDEEGGEHYNCGTGGCYIPGLSDPGYSPRTVGNNRNGWSTAGSGNGQAAPARQSTCPVNPNGVPKTEPVSGFPVILSTGAKMLPQSDFLHVSPLTLALTRTYKSSNTTSNLMFGDRWSSNFDYKVYGGQYSNYEYLNGQLSPLDLTISLPDGSAYAFYRPRASTSSPVAQYIPFGRAWGSTSVNRINASHDTNARMLIVNIGNRTYKFKQDPNNTPSSTTSISTASGSSEGFSMDLGVIPLPSTSPLSPLRLSARQCDSLGATAFTSPRSRRRMVRHGTTVTTRTACFLLSRHLSRRWAFTPTSTRTPMTRGA